MPRSTVPMILAAVLVFVIASSVSAAPANSTASTKPAIKPSTSLAQKSPAQKLTASAPKSVRQPIVRTVETQLSGFTSQDAEQFYTRLSLQETRKSQNWYIRGALSRTETRNGSSHSEVMTSKLDSRLQHMISPNVYSVVTGVLSRRDRNPSSKTYPRDSGYQFISYGYGRPLGPKANGDIGLGLLQVFDDGGSAKPALMCAVRGTHSISRVLSWESDVLVFQPMDSLSDMKIDSEVGLVHDLSPGLSLRFTWTLNNLIRSVNSNREWDSGARVSISYRHTTTK